jgi:hypothetical protein
MELFISLVSFGLLVFLLWNANKSQREHSGKAVWIYKKFGPAKYLSDGPTFLVNSDESERAWTNWKEYGIDVPDYIPLDKKSREERFLQISDHEIAAMQVHAKTEADFAKEAAEFKMKLKDTPPSPVKLNEELKIERQRYTFPITPNSNDPSSTNLQWTVPYNYPFDAHRIDKLWTQIKGYSLRDASIKFSGLFISDNWSGLSTLAPIIAKYTFDNFTNQNLSGKVDFRVGGMSSCEGQIKTQSATADVSIPGDVISQALTKLDDVMIHRKAYTPFSTHTDDYPEIKIELLIENERLTFLSTSQEPKLRTPWIVLLGEHKWVSDSPEVSQVMELLDPFLQRKMQKHLIDLALASPVECDDPF